MQIIQFEFSIKIFGLKKKNLLTFVSFPSISANTNDYEANNNYNEE